MLLFARPAAATIRYHISLKNPEQHSFHVSMQIPAGETDRDSSLRIPAWNALYQVRDFAYRVCDVRASTPGSPTDRLAVEKLDKQTWKISLSDGSSRSAVVNYDDRVE